MITLLKSYVANPVDNNTIKSRAVIKLTGLSTDEKPLIEFKGIEIENGSSFIQIDTSKIYKYDEENNEWIQQIIESGSDSLNNDVSDVQVNGTSIVADGVAEIPIASADNFGVSKVVSSYGLYVNQQTGTLRINAAPISTIKYSTNTFYPITPGHQHESTFYGLAKASGDTTQSQSDNEVGVYTEDAKFAIRTMLGLQDVYEDYSSALVALGVIDNG